VHRAQEVRLDHAAVRLGRHLLEAAEHDYRGVVHPRVESPEVLDGPPRQLFDSPEVGDVRRYCEGPSAQRLAFGDHLEQRTLPAARTTATAPGEETHRAPDAARSALATTIEPSSLRRALRLLLSPFQGLVVYGFRPTAASRSFFRFSGGPCQSAVPTARCGTGPQLALS
jgi:hypothetical protein